MTAQVVIAGYGSGSACHLCGHAIEPNQVAYEAHDARNDRWLSFHIACHAKWQLQCRGSGSPATAEHHL
jgi:hypothetical protein